MTSSPSDMSIMDLLFDKVDPLLKSGIKDESFIDDSYDNDNIANEEWTTTTSYQDDFLNSFLCDNQFSLMDQETITKGLDTIPSPSSDSGLSSAFSLSCEQQLSPLLPIDDDQMEITNPCLYSPQNPMELDYLDSPNQSVSSVDSSARSVVSSNIGSPLTETTEEMECHQTFLTIVNPQVAEDINDETTIDQKPIIDFDTNPKQRVHITSHENTINLRNISCNGKRNVRQLIRVTPIGSRNSRSLLLPLNSSDIKEVRTIKIVNAVPARNLKGFKLNQGNVLSKNLQIKIKKEDLNSEKIVRDNNEVTENISQYHPLKLNAEEKRLLQKEGITLPTHYPLTKTEERELKRIRRKIRNKISAQDSRKRKKEYVDGLEDRVKQCTEENLTLLKRIKVLQSQNQSLAGQLKRLQALIQKGNKSAQPATCLMVFLLSLALVAAPNLRPHSNANSNELSQEQKQEKITPLAGRSRTLLYTRQLMEEELQQYGEELLQEVEGLMDHDYSPIQMPVYKKQRFDSELSDKNILTDLVGGTLGSINNINSNPSLKYIEPPLDDDWPPPKPGGLSETKIVDKLEVLTKELKLNISDTEGIRTVLVNVPKE